MRSMLGMTKRKVAENEPVDDSPSEEVSHFTEALDSALLQKAESKLINEKIKLAEDERARKKELADGQRKDGKLKDSQTSNKISRIAE